MKDDDQENLQKNLHKTDRVKIKILGPKPELVVPHSNSMNRPPRSESLPKESAKIVNSVTVSMNGRRKDVKSARDFGTNDGKAHHNILAHLDHEKIQREIYDCGKYPRYCPVRIDGIQTFAFMDSGNCLPNVISESFAAKLGFPRSSLRAIPKLRKVGTAKAASDLVVLGTTPRALKLRIGGSQRRIPFRPLVIENLAMEVNLGGPFMRRARIDQLHSQGVLSIDGTQVPVLTKRQCENAQISISSIIGEKNESVAYVANTINVPSQSACYLPLRVCFLDNLKMQKSPGFIEAGADFAHKSGVLPLQLAVVSPDENNLVWTSVWNPSDRAITIPEDLKFGEFSNSPDNRVFSIWNDPTTDSGMGKEEMEDPTDPGVLKRKQNEAKIRLSQITPSKLEATIKEFRLDESPFLQADSSLKEEAAKLLIEFDDIMGRDDRIGRTTLVEHDIDTGDLPPIRMKARPINPVQEEDLKRQLQQWLKQGIIKEANSEWRFPMVPAVKKNTDKLRWASDLRYLNASTRVDSFQMPDLSDNLSRLARSEVFSALDCSGAFLNVPLTDRAKERCCFGTPLGNYMFLFMPFGLTNAPATFSRLMQKVFENIPSNEALVFLDDALAHSKCPRKHLDILRRIFRRYRYAGLTLQPRKTHLFKADVDYLGYHVSKDGLSVVPDYVKVVRDWPLPSTAKEIQIFLGKTGYYRRFIKDYSKYAGPLSEYLKTAHAKGDFSSPLELSSEAKSCFEQLKMKLCEAPILAFPDFKSEEPFILDTDFSGKSIGAVLSQKQGGFERVIAYGAKKLLPRETNYSSNKGELLAVVYFIEKFKYFLSHRKFILRTDHQALKWLTTMKCPKGMYSRWQELLAHYHFDVKFREGDKHSNADCLSRISHAPSDDRFSEEGIGAIRLLPTDRVSAQDLRKFQEEDAELHDVKRWVLEGKRPSPEMERHLGPVQRSLLQVFPTLRMTESGILVVVDPIEKRERICLPDVLQERTIQLAHEFGHQGIGNTFHKIRKRFHFWNMAKKVELFVKCCLACQKKQGKAPDQKHTYVDVQTGYPGQVWAIDLVGPLEETDEGFKHILTAKDVFTRWIEAIPILSTDAETIARELEKEVFSRHGLPEQVHSDNAHNISGTVLQEICQQLGVKKSVTPDYNPKSNPVERAHRDLGSSLRAIMEETNQNWVACLPSALLALRTTKCRATGFTPFFLTYGRDAQLPVDLVVGSEPGRKLGPVQYANELYLRMNASFKIARKNQGELIDKTRKYYTKDSDVHFLDEGQKVWLYTPRLKKGESRKLHSMWSGPWIVSHKTSEVLRRIQTVGEWNSKKLDVVVSIDRLKPYFSHEKEPGAQVTDNLSWEDVALDDEEVDNGTLRNDRERGLVVQPQIQIQLPTNVPEIVDLNPPPESLSKSQEYMRQPPFNPEIFDGSIHSPTAPELSMSASSSSPMPTDAPTDDMDGQDPAPEEAAVEEPRIKPTLPPKKNPLVPRSVIVPVKRDLSEDLSNASTSSSIPPGDILLKKKLRRSERIRIKKLRQQVQKVIDDASTSDSNLVREEDLTPRRPKKKKPRRIPSDESSSIFALELSDLVQIIQTLQADLNNE